MINGNAKLNLIAMSAEQKRFITELKDVRIPLMKNKNRKMLDFEIVTIESLA